MPVDLLDDPVATTEPVMSAAPAPRRGLALLRTAAVESSMTTVAFLLVFGIYGLWLGSTFFNVDARLLDVHENAPILLLGLAVMVSLVAGQFDLSVASMATLTCFLSVGLTVNQGWPFGLVLATCVLVGAIGGLANAALVVGLKVNSFIATLGTGGILVGVSNVYSGGTQITPDGSRTLPGWFTGEHSLGAFGQKFPEWILIACSAAVALAAWHALMRRLPATWPARALMAAAIVAVAVAALVIGLDLPAWWSDTTWTIAVLLAVAGGLWVLLRFTMTGRHLQATGANPTAARLAGVRPGRETTKAFVLGGLLAALAGIVLAANQGSAAPDVGAAFLLPAFAAAFLSTVVLSHGRFSVWGTVLGGVFIVWVGQGLIVGGLTFTWTSIVNGVVLVVAVALSTAIRRSPA